MRRLLLPLLAVSALAVTALAVNPHGNQEARESRVEPDSTPIAPTIPDADRSDQSRVFLEQADRLLSNPNQDFQILTGSVKFRRGGMHMYCDSAHFYDTTGSFEAYGNVKMEQGDTLFVYADELNYDDPMQLAVLYADPGKKVRLINRDVTLTTDVFNYDLQLDLGYYDVGGELSDAQNRLTSQEGEYSPSTKEATFRDMVHLTSRSENDTLDIYTDYLDYNTVTHIAILNAPSTVHSGDGTIYTTNGEYNTETEFASLFERSTVVAANGNTLTGDTLYYDRQLGRGEAFGSMVLCDTTNKMIMEGNYGFYNELTDSCFVTGRARAMEYSNADTLYFHADSIRAFRVIATKLDSVLISNPMPRITDYVADSAAILVDSLSAANVVAKPTSNFSAADSVTVSVAADSVTVSLANDSVAALAADGLVAGDSIVAFVAVDSIAGRNTIEIPDSVAPAAPQYRYFERPDTTRLVIASPHVKFYRKDVQGLCDSLAFVSTDTLIHMHYRPIIWSENRQILGDSIIIHLNDSTIENALIPTSSFMAEEIEVGYYNQLSGKEMIAYFTNGQLRHLDVNGNVLAITFPEEKDSTINKVVNIESSFLAADFKNNAIERMRLWSKTDASVTPLYLAKRSIFFLPNFKWWGKYRPTSPDDIFNFSEELLQLFAEARAAVAPASQTSAPARRPAQKASQALDKGMPLLPSEQNEEDETVGSEAGSVEVDAPEAENSETEGAEVKSAEAEGTDASEAATQPDE